MPFRSPDVAAWTAEASQIGLTVSSSPINRNDPFPSYFNHTRAWSRALMTRIYSLLALATACVSDTAAEFGYMYRDYIE